MKPSKMFQLYSSNTSRKISAKLELCMRAVHYNIFMGTQHLGNLINGYLGWNSHEGCSRYWLKGFTRSNVCQQKLHYLICCLHKILANVANTNMVKWGDYFRIFKIIFNYF